MKHLQHFRKYYQLSPKADLSPVSISVESTCEANDIAFNFIGNIENKTNADGLAVHVHLNIIGRIFEQTQGMLVCIATRCPTSSEAIARVVIEGSVNLMYLSLKGNDSTLIGFFDSWLSEHRKKLVEWKQREVGHEHESYVIPMIDERLGLVSDYDEFLEQIILTCNITRKPHKEVWPKSLFERFSELGMENDYYTSYHRLSGSSHISGEDTLSWLLTLHAGEHAKHKVGKEAIAYSVMMSRIASLFFVDAALACCVAHGFESPERFNNIRKNLINSVSEIAEAAGVPTIGVSTRSPDGM